jgi:D-galactarolactone cycloisomerase
LRITEWVVYKPDFYDVILEIRTDDGFSGWGAAFSEARQVHGALDWLKRFVISEDPLEVERVTEKLHQVTYWIGRGGAMTHAISAINIALWDLSGKILNQPVSTLLGGRYRESVQAYASILAHPVATLSDRIEKVKLRGFKALKIGWDPILQQSFAEDEALVRTARSVARDEATILIDAGGSAPFWPVRFKDALERARMLANYGVYWLEEPLAPDDIEGYKRLTDLSPIKIAHGEVLTRRQSFRQYFNARAMDIVQPDVAKVGGLSEMRRIAWLAQDFDIELVPHGWNTAVGLAADLQLVSTLSSRTFVEFNFGNKLIDELVDEPFRLDANGCLAIPSGPGFGISMDRERLQGFCSAPVAREIWTWDTSRQFEVLNPDVH